MDEVPHHSSVTLLKRYPHALPLALHQWQGASYSQCHVLLAISSSPKPCLTLISQGDQVRTTHLLWCHRYEIVERMQKQVLI